MNDERLLEIIDKLENDIEVFFKSIATSLKEHQRDLQSVLKIIAEIEESFSGSWLGYHAYLYYSNFQRPPIYHGFNSEFGFSDRIQPNWVEKTYEDIVNAVNIEYEGKELNKIKEDLIKIDKKELHDEICSQLAFLRNLEGYKKENEILDEIEEIKWRIPSYYCIENFKPKGRFITCDSLATSQGIKIPPHIEYKCQVYCCISIIDSLEKFISRSKRLLKQLKMRLSINPVENIEIPDSIEKVKLLCTRFHFVVKALKNRHSNKQPLQIDDEYDIQYLFYALLKLFFDDVRPEESVPSDSGSSSRADFLLKDEKIVIETKNVRNTLNDKKLGEELIIDIEKYKTHPDFKILICFIYDQDGKLKNPDGLINDLNEKSSEELEVLVFIEP